MADKKKLPITENHQSTLQICKQVAMEDKKLPTDNQHQQSLADWVMDMESKVLNPQSWQNEEDMLWKQQCIYRIPKGFCHPDRMKAYQPQVVSLGPYHHGEEQLNPMEEHKERAFLHFLARTKKSVHDYTDALSKVGEQLIMDSYDKLDKEWKLHPDKFLKLMMVDGCFMFELFLNITTPNDNPICERIPPVLKYSKYDPIFSRHAMISIMPRIVRDMLMIENQIPLLVLKTLLTTALSSPQKEEMATDLCEEAIGGIKKLSEKTELGPVDNAENRAAKDAAASSERHEPIGKTDPDDGLLVKEINNLVLKFLNAHPKPASKEDVHVLDMVRKSMIQHPPPSDEKRRRKAGEKGSPAPTMDVIWPAMELAEAGIHFKRSKTRSLNDIKFEKDGGLLYLPEIVVDDATESKLLNIMAFEQLHAGVVGNDVSSYVSFMDNIIDSEKDVSLLAKRKILKNFVGTDQLVAQLFNGIAQDVSIDPNSSLEKVHREVVAYCKKDWNKWKANLKHTYFKSPWALISLVAAIFALAITVAGFVYSVIAYYQT